MRYALSKEKFVLLYSTSQVNFVSCLYILYWQVGHLEVCMYLLPDILVLYLTSIKKVVVEKIKALGMGEASVWVS